jgi:hypothetical protein
MIETRLECSFSFDFVLSDTQRQDVERSMRHPGIIGVRWVQYPMKRFDTAVVELSTEWGSGAIADTVQFVEYKTRKLEELKPVSAVS